MSAGVGATHTWTTAGGVRIERQTWPVTGETELTDLIASLDATPGMVLTSGVEYPGRYSRYDLGYAAPPVELVAAGRTVTISALNARGEVILPALAAAAAPHLTVTGSTPARFAGTVPEAADIFAEEDRTRRPGVFTVLRAILAAFAPPASAAHPDDAYLGLYGAFGYDLVFQFEDVAAHLARPESQRDLVLHLPDELIVVDRRRETAYRHTYDFTVDGASTAGLPRQVPTDPYVGGRIPAAERDHAPGEYAELVTAARQYFARGDLFEVVPSQTFSLACESSPVEVFRRLSKRNPAPFGFLANLGTQEYLVGASPEMFVRVEPRPDGRYRVETTPVSGTIERGENPIADAHQILTLLSSTKEESELTMCTDVDRNDKARVCVPGTVEVIGRRQIEMASRLIHTVDHVEGILRPDRDALDAFLTHAWAVTVTGAPKRAAIEFIEQRERSPRRWYGGAVGLISFDGRMNTGLTLRTIQIRDGVATVRAGATLLFDSEPAAEEAETELKARALLDAIRDVAPPGARTAASFQPRATPGRRVLFVDCQDSFVHMLADYFRQVGADVITYRHDFPAEVLEEFRPELVVLSPGPGRPKDFGLDRAIRLSLDRQIPIFGVCLGLQGIVEYLGGTLGQAPVPTHGKPSTVRLTGDGGTVLAGLPETFTAGRYHSLYADEQTLPAELTVTARTEDGMIMGIEHRTRPLAAVQFHPESIMSTRGASGLTIIDNVVAGLT